MRRRILIILMALIPILCQGQTNGREVRLDDFPVLIDGYRLQMGAFADEANAVVLRDTLRLLTGQKVGIRFEDQLWRVRLGQFEDSTSARAYLAQNGAFLAQYQPRIVADNITGASNQGGEHQILKGYRIQVEALSDSGQAVSLGLKLNFDYRDIRTYVICADDIYRVQMGDFRERTTAETWLGEHDEFATGWIIASPVYEHPPPPPIERPEIDIFQYMD